MFGFVDLSLRQLWLLGQALLVNALIEIRTAEEPEENLHGSSGARSTVFVLEGGYALTELGVNTLNVLDGFEAAD